MIFPANNACRGLTTLRLLRRSGQAPTRRHGEKYLVLSEANPSGRGGIAKAIRCRFTVLMLIIFQSFFSSLSAQHVVFFERDSVYMNNGYEHTAIKPYLDIDLPERTTGSGQLPNGAYWIRSGPRLPRMTFRNYYRHRKDTSAFEEGGSSTFLIKPVYDFQVGSDLKSNSTLINTAAGIVLDADYKQKIGIEARFVSGITTLPNYQDSIASTFGIVPGWGDRAYPMGNGKYSFQHLSGNIIWRPTPVFNLQVGRDKHFWGDGHRSLFLGDQGAAIPYIKAQTTIWKLQYTSLFTWLQDWTQSTGSKNDFRSKFASMHYLSVNFTKWLNIGIFESVVWQGTDNNRSRWFDANYLNPLVFFRPVEYSIGSSDNAMLGIAGKIRFNRNNVLYGQIILDEFYLKEIKAWKDGWWANKQGVQIGYKCYNIGQVDNFLMQMELNIVRPYTYSHGSPQQSYTNGGMPLAHPMGANFAETIGILSYHWNGLTVTGKLVGIRYGADVNDTMNYGQNIFQSYITRENEYGNKLFQGYATNVFLAEFHASYAFNTKFPLRIEFTAGARSEKNAVRSLKSSYIMGGLCLPLWRAQRDY